MILASYSTYDLEDYDKLKTEQASWTQIAEVISSS